MTKPTQGKTPYEIRLELLQMAQKHLQDNFDRQMEFAMKALTMANDASQKSIEELQKLMPAAFSMNDIVAKAGELYGFVQKKD